MELRRAVGLDNLGWVLLQEGEPEGAGSCFTDALRSPLGSGDRWGTSLIPSWA